MTGQRSYVTELPLEASWGEAFGRILDRLHLPANPGDGEETVWTARLDREGRHLHNSEIVGDVLEPNDALTIQRDIAAG